MTTKDTQLNLYSTIRCPECDHMVKEKMPVNACAYFWECPSCESVVQAKEGDCCVYCSYGDNPCPPIQQNQSCC